MPTLLLGNCLEKLAEMPDCSIDAIVTDPPYGLSFMGKKWDYDVPSEDIWRECLRVLKPGGHLLAFAGTRTQHRMAVRIEDAGFEIRDMIAWVYGSGFPKSHNVGKNIEKIKVGGIKNLKEIGTKKGIKCEPGTEGYSYSKEYVAGKSTGGRQISGDIPVHEINNEWGGWGTALKPALEPITVARKPFKGTVAANVLAHGTGGLNVDGCRVGTEVLPEQRAGQAQLGTFERGEMVTPERTGRWPANLIHDGSDEVVGLFPQTGNGNNKGVYSYAGKEYDNKNTSMFNGDEPQAPSNFNDSGSAARFFYCAKTSKRERGEGNTHPTVKPIALMRYLCRLVTPTGGTVLDPFMGSGSTGIAAGAEGFNFVGIELDPDYFAIAERRIKENELLSETLAD
jgi:DNA modification methylase